MKEIQVKEIMIPLADYTTVGKEQTLIDAIKTVGEDRESGERARRDAAVIDDKGQFVGKITVMDIFKALEPKYKNKKTRATQSSKTRQLFGDTIAENMENMIEEFDLWAEPMTTLHERGKKLIVSQIVHIPKPNEYINETDSLEKALHKFVFGVHQPLVVKNGNQVSGFLRIGDLVEIVRNKLLED